MRVLAVNKRAPFEGRGGEQVIWKIGERLAAEGHEVLFFTGSPQDDTDIPDLDGIRFEFVETEADPTRGMIKFFLKGPTAYPRAYCEFEPDLVYDNPSPFPFHLAHLYGDVPVVSKVHAVYRRLAFSCKDHPLVKLGTVLGEETYRLARGEYFITNSESTAERLTSLVNTERNQVIANPIGIDSDEFTFNFRPDSRQVLALSKLSPRKGLRYLIDAWKQVEDAVPSANLVIAGSGPRRKALELRATANGLKRVEFTGFVDDEQKHELLRESTVYVLPTLYEGFGISNLEAMASGCAVVSTDTWGVKDYLQNRENGLVTPPKDSDSIGKALKQVLQHESLHERLAKRGRDTAEGYSISESIDREIHCLESILNYSMR